jgi:hypothetical protein
MSTVTAFVIVIMNGNMSLVLVQYYTVIIMQKLTALLSVMSEI